MRVATLMLMIAAACALAVGPASIASWRSLGGNAGDEPVATVLESDAGHMLVEVTLPGYWLYEYPGGGRTWDKVELAGCGHLGEVGMPDLPSVTELFALPFGTEASITVEEMVTSEVRGVELLPMQTPAVDMDHAPYEFRMDDQFYGSGATYPAENVYIDNEAVWSGLNVARLVVTPFTYDHGSGELTVIHSITLRVEFEGTPTRLAEPVTTDIARAMERSVINWADFEEAAMADLDGRDGVEYVVVCNSSNRAYVEDLFSTHHYLGLNTMVEEVSNPSNPGEIRAAICDNYETGVTRFALLVGDHSVMPSAVIGGYTGDFYYTLITGSDNMPDIAVGRLTGSNTQIAHQVDKIIDGWMAYDWNDQNTTGIDPSETVLVAHQEQYPYKYTQCCNEIAAYDYDLCDVTFYKVYPPEGGTAADVSSAINNGIGTVGYRGHGDVTYWSWSPGWNASNINALTNDLMPPVFNIACYNGQYYTGTTCLSEAWQWADNGASGNLGATQPSYTTANHDYMKQIYIALYDTGLFRVGEAINVATEYVINNHGSYGLANARQYIWFGDPAQDIWTFDTAGEPGTLEISCPGSIAPGAQNVTITVTDGGSPVSGVNVTATDGIGGCSDAMTFYEEGTTNGSGQVTLSFTAPSSGTIHVGAWMHDYEYDIEEMDIMVGVGEGSGSTADLRLDRPVPNPVTTGASFGVGLPTTGAVSLEVYDVAGRLMETVFDGSLESGTHSIDWVPGSGLSNGVYFVRLTTGEGTLTTQAMVLR